MTPPRVAITGIGLVTALGLTREENWTSLLNGTCGMGEVTVFRPRAFAAGSRRRCRTIASGRASRRCSGAGGPAAISSGSSPRWKRSPTAA